ncbi:hypothetical protein [Xanthomonas phage JGB6]|nr:hypothetical protein [Xanthomonas phage JGB6]
MSTATLNAIQQMTEVVGRVTRMLSQRTIDVIQEGMKIGVEYDSEGALAKSFCPVCLRIRRLNCWLQFRASG